MRFNWKSFYFIAKWIAVERNVRTVALLSRELVKALLFESTDLCFQSLSLPEKRSMEGVQTTGSVNRYMNRYIILIVLELICFGSDIIFLNGDGDENVRYRQRKEVDIGCSYN